MQRSRHWRIETILALALLIAFAALALPRVVLTPPPQATSPYWPTAVWRTAPPEEQGVDSTRLAMGLQAIRERGFNIHSLLVVRDGFLVLDTYFYPYDGTTPHELASVTKSVMTTLIGIAADQGKLRLDQPVVSFFPDRAIANRDARKERITVAHLASMSSGLECTAEPDEPTLDEMRASPDWIAFVLDRPVVAEPGSTFVYCSPGMHLLSAILTTATGMSTLEFARANLFEPLGIEEVLWPADAQGFNHGWGDIYLHPRDAAKLGYLWLEHGVWEGRQVVSRAWVEDSVRVHAVTGGEEDYGYGWWIGRDSDVGGEYHAIGRGGQRIAVYPALDIVAMTTGGGFDPGEALDLLGSAVVDTHRPLPANPDGLAHLRETVASLLQGPAPQPVPPLPAMAQATSGQAFAFGPSWLELATLRVEFDGSAEATVELTFHHGRNPPAWTIGLDGVYRMNPGDYGFPLGLRGYWADAQTFVLDYDEIANRDAFLLHLRFQGDTVTIEAKERTHEAAVQLEGRAIDR